MALGEESRQSGVEGEPCPAHTEQAARANAQLEKLFWRPHGTQDEQWGQYRGKLVVPGGK